MKKLGRGLSELGLNELLSNTQRSESLTYDKIHHLPVNALTPGEYQPRQHIEQTALTELAESIRSQGILQPLIVRPSANQHYEIIAGERRWRAAQLIGLEKVPVIVREISNQTAVAFGLIENIQRRDLNALEEAQALQRLLQEFHLTHEAVAQAVGKPRSTISNLLRLLQLNADVKKLLREGLLEMGHTKALLALTGPAQSECAAQVVAKQLSVRQTEALVQEYQRGESVALPGRRQQQMYYAVESQQNLAEKLGTKVAIRHNTHGKGKMVIHYRNLDELSKILSRIQ